MDQVNIGESGASPPTEQKALRRSSRNKAATQKTTVSPAVPDDEQSNVRHVILITVYVSSIIFFSKSVTFSLRLKQVGVLPQSEERYCVYK